tara:strand:+ start:4025 stop:4462 length:438 start_codon:yes stop_codon:yes gene_type:complete
VNLLKIFLPFIFLLQFLHAADNESLIRELEESLMAPCCWSGTVADHGNSQMEEEIVKLAGNGKTMEEITLYFVSIYGERILAKPKAEGFNLLVWIMPLMVSVTALFILFNYIKHKQPAPNLEEIKQRNDKVPFDDIIEKELSEMG